MEKSNKVFIEILKEEFRQRQVSNLSYSLRSFAKELGILPSRLSEIFSGKQGLSGERANLIADRLKLSPERREQFVQSVLSRHARSKASREIAKKTLVNSRLNPIVSISAEQFDTISHWIYMAIYESPLLVHRNQVSQVAQYFGQAEAEIESVIDRLEKLNLIRIAADGAIERASFHISTTDNIPSPAIQNFHQQMIQKSLECLRQFSVNERSFSSINISLSPEDFQEAQKMLVQFRRTLIRRFQARSANSDVYALNLNLFPLRQPGESAQ